MRVPSGTPSSDITRSISEPLHRSASRCARTCVSCQATVRALGLLRHFPPPAPSQTSLGFLLRSLAGALARPSLLLFPLTQNCWAKEGLNVLAEALLLMRKTGERYWEAELYRLKGELTLQKEFKVQSSTFQVETPQSTFPNPQLEAEECFLKAIEVAQRQQAKSLELRATVSLVRLWQQQGKPHEAHRMLSEVYNWFTEGFDTKDLQEAKALLESLISSDLPSEFS